MKIRSKLTISYSIITAVLMLLFALVIFISSTKEREKEFFLGLKKEGISTANLYFENSVSTEVLRSIYRSNIQYIDEVDVSIYSPSLELLYQDSDEQDLSSDQVELLSNVIIRNEDVKMYDGKVQVIFFHFIKNGQSYIISASAYDGYGYAKLRSLTINLLLLTLVVIIILFIIGYYMAKKTLTPISEMSDKMKMITANRLHLRLNKYNEKDEFGELASSFNKTLDIIERSFESQKLFVSNISHELRTPLTSLLTEIDLTLLKDRPQDEYKRVLLNLQYDAKRILSFFNGLLNLTKASYDESNISMSPLRMDEILLDSRIALLKSNPQYTINLIFTQVIESDLEMNVIGNSYLLKMAFINLMDNNCKFSGNKTSSVHISFFNKKIILLFCDAGVGIAKEEKEMIFTPFYRGGNTKDVDGNGIGMALVKKVIQLHKGTIKISSELGVGTIFQVDIPICQREEEML